MVKKTDNRRGIRIIAVLLLTGALTVAACWFGYAYLTGSSIPSEDFTEQVVGANPSDVLGEKDDPATTDNTPKEIDVMDVSTLKQETAFTEGVYSAHAGPIATNQWFTSNYFRQGSENFFGFPLAYNVSENAFRISYPRINVQPQIIFGSFSQDVALVFDRPIVSRVKAYSELSVTLELSSVGTEELLATIYLTRGSLYVNISLTEAGSGVLWETPGTIELTGTEQKKYLTRNNDTKFAIYALDNLILTGSEDRNQIAVGSDFAVDGERLVVGVLPEGMTWAQLDRYAAQFNMSSDFTLTSTEASRVDFDKETYWAILPHHQQSIRGALCNQDMRFQTIRGAMIVCEGKSFDFISEATVPAEQINVGTFTEEEKEVLRRLVREETEAFADFAAPDTYFRGKEILRLAYLYDLAVQLTMDATSDSLKSTLRREFANWRTNTIVAPDGLNGEQYFVYDNIIRGVVGHKTSFGSERFNDHHFHYGYFVHAAAIIARHDESFVADNGDFVNTLVSDYANINASNQDFSLVRSFDFYEGHSWAAGESLFGDGNNQESTSEAIQAYYAAYLWARTIGADALANKNLWLFNQETASARMYWLLSGEGAPTYEGYEPSAVSLLWGGKAEWATWFSGEPEAKLGIQLIPFTPGSTYLNKISNENIKRHLAETAFPEQKLFYDLLLMYYAVADPQDAERIFRTQEAAGLLELDGGNSKSYLFAWILFQKYVEKND